MRLVISMIVASIVSTSYGVYHDMSGGSQTILYFSVLTSSLLIFNEFTRKEANK